jgi:hypothetical protein
LALLARVAREPKLPDFMFTVYLQGTGSTEEEAWEDANEAFFLEPGDPESAQRLDTFALDPEYPQWPGPSQTEDDLCRTPLVNGRKFVYLFRVHLYGIGTSEDEAWAEVTEEIRESEYGTMLVGFEDQILLHVAEADASQMELFQVDDEGGR